MIKGIAQKDRDSAWHKRHTRKKAAHTLYRANAIRSGKIATAASVRKIKEADEKYKLAQASEAKIKMGISGWLGYTWKRFIGKIKGVFNFKYLWPKTSN